MKRRDRKDASPEAARPETATPFFARYLEGQSAEADAEAKVSEGRGQSNFTYKETARSTKKGGAKADAKSGAKKGSAKSAATSGNAKARPPLQTLKYPSDRDELVFYAYHLEAAEAKASRQTMKYPSDSDEDTALYAVYADAKEAPKSDTAKAKPKETGVRLSRKKPKA
jgi:hypothetical protein